MKKLFKLLGKIIFKFFIKKFLTKSPIFISSASLLKMEVKGKVI